MYSKMDKPSNYRVLDHEEIEYDGGMSDEVKGTLIGLVCGVAAFGILGGELGMAVYRETLSTSAAVKIATGFTVTGGAIGSLTGYCIGHDKHCNPDQW